MVEKHIEVRTGLDGQPISATRRDSDSKPFQAEIEVIANVAFTDEQNRKVLRKIDMLCVLLPRHTTPHSIKTSVNGRTAYYLSWASHTCCSTLINLR